MAITYKKQFEPLKLSNAAALIFTVDAAPVSNILMNGRVKAVNNTNVTTTVTLYAVPSGGAADLTDILENATTVLGNDKIFADLPEMKAGDSLWAFAGTNNAITLHYMDGVVHSN